VRGLCNLPGVGFVSASNDMTLRVWTLAGDTVAELVGHTALVYSCAATDEGLILSGALSQMDARVIVDFAACLSA
jgi:phospholipase A-2-activating protein